MNSELEQAIIAKNIADERLRLAICEVMGTASLPNVAEALGISQMTAHKWRNGGVPSIRMAKIVLDRMVKQRIAG